MSYQTCDSISGYRDDSLETVKKNRDDYELPLKILSYKDLYGWTMDAIVEQVIEKNKNPKFKQIITLFFQFQNSLLVFWNYVFFLVFR